MRARDIIIIVVARVDRVSSLAGSIGTPRDARARSKDEGWIGAMFLRAVASRVLSPDLVSRLGVTHVTGMLL